MLFNRRELLLGSAALAVGVVQSLPALANAVMDRELMEDAETAWRFFQLPGNAPGLVPAMTRGEGRQHQVLTMWDIGSLILGYVSARRIGLISETEFGARIDDVLAFLGKTEFMYRDNRLPNYRNSSVDGSSVEDGFDSTDMGRLLVALKVLDAFTAESLGVKHLVASWDIAAAVVDGVMQDIKGGIAFPSTSYLYANYVSRGYGLWDIPHSPVLPDFRPLHSDAARAAFLGYVRSVGAIATEPHLNEAVEMGMSEPAQVIARELGEAQKRRHAESGILTCVSEGPIDEEPWFTYQGYEMGVGNGGWSVYTPVASPKWQSASFMNRVRMVSSKAAFLWLAHRPDDYSRLLHGLARTTASRSGFSAGIYEQSGEASKVCDVNTNSVILEAIAYIMNGRQPILASAGPNEG